MSRDWTQALTDRASGVVRGFVGGNDDLTTDVESTEDRSSGAVRNSRSGQGFMTTFNIRDFGAVGDGVTDDTTAIKAALLAAKAAPYGALVHSPSGVYLTRPQIQPANVVISGETRGSTTWKLKDGSNADLLVLENFAANTGTTQNGPSGFGLESITLDANKAGQTSLSRCWVVYGYNYTVDDVWFINGFGGGVYSEWNGTDNPMESAWTNFKIWNYGGQANTTGLDWNGPHDSQFTQGVIATLSSSILTTTASYGATPIDGSTAALPNTGTPFTFVTTTAAPVAEYPTSGGTFILPLANSSGLNDTWTLVTYTSAATVGAVTTFSGCTATNNSGNIRTVVPSSGIVGKPCYGIRTNLGAGAHGAVGEQFTQVHVWGRHHFAWWPGEQIWCNNCEIEGAFIVNLMVMNYLQWLGGSIYGTNGQAGQVHECGIQLGTNSINANRTNVQVQIFNIGAASSNGAAIMTCNSGNYNVIRVNGSTLNTQRYMSRSNSSDDFLEVICKSNPALSIIAFPNANGSVNPVQFGSGVSLGNTGSRATSITGAGGLQAGSGAPTIAGVVGQYYLRTDTPSTSNQRIYICTVAGAAGAATWAGIV